jgi:ATP-dependent helicase HepA
LVEQRRRFNLRFALFDENRCEAAAGSVAGANPFNSEQLVLAGLGLVAGSPERSAQAAAAGWDVVVVDEAHHLVSEGEHTSPEYAAVQRIAGSTSGLLLLTATPQQLGERSHFARLHLLDPQRYDDFDRWKQESLHYQEAASVGQRLIEGTPPTPDETAALARMLGDDVVEVRSSLDSAKGRTEVLDRLIDRHGPGRAMFRNTRAAMPRFPEREITLHPLPAPSDAGHRKRLAAELAADLGTTSTSRSKALTLTADPRVEYLLEVLSGEDPRKLLVFCANAAKAQAVKDAIEAVRRIDIAVFHEQLTLVQRDRNAAWFAEPEGARILICSEIGSEGRNFQHAQHLLMLDLPLDPDLVEQRIGRLDRIGQQGVVHIDVPYIEGSGSAVLARWQHEGIGVFARPTTSSQPLLERFGTEVVRLATSLATREFDTEVEKELSDLILETRQAHADLTLVVEQGRDRLLEMASLRQPRADELIAAVAEAATDEDFEDFTLRLLERFHIYAEEVSPRCYLLNPDSLRAVELPSLGAGKRTVTFDREIALLREDFEFLSWDHPLIADAIEHLCATDRGNACFTQIEGPLPARMLLETVFVLESVAPRALHSGRFLPPTPIRIVTDHKGRPVDDADELLSDPTKMEICPRDWVTERQSTLREMFDTMLTSAEKRAELQASELRSTATDRLRSELGREARRLRELAEINQLVDTDEAEHVEQEMEQLEEHVSRSRLRLDCARLTWIGPPLSSKSR